MGIKDKVDFSSGFRKVLSNIGYLFSEQVFNLALSLFVGVYVARYLGPNDYGLWQYAQSLVALLTAVATLGTTQIVIRDLVDQPREKEGQILGTSFILMLIAGFITTGIIIAIGFWLNNQSLTRWLIVIASVNLVLQAFQAFDYWFQAKVLSKYSVYARTSAQIIISVLKIFFVILSLNVIYFALTIIIAGLIRLIIWVYSYEKQSQKISNWSFDPGYAKSLMKNAWPLILTGMSIAIYMKIDQVMLKTMVDAKAVGIYSVAVKIAQLWYFIPVAIASSVFPAIIKSKKEGIEKYYNRIQSLYDVMAGIALAIAIPMTFASNFIINLLYGQAYTLAGGVLAVQIWAGVFVFMGIAQSKWLINENYQHYEMIFSITGAISNIILNLWLIPKIGIMGAAWATLIAYMLNSWITSFFFDKTRISFKMISLALFRVLLILPAINSIKNILIEAKNDR